MRKGLQGHIKIIVYNMEHDLKEWMGQQVRNLEQCETEEQVIEQYADIVKNMAFLTIKYQDMLDKLKQHKES